MSVLRPMAARIIRMLTVFIRSRTWHLIICCPSWAIGVASSRFRGGMQTSGYRVADVVEDGGPRPQKALRLWVLIMMAITIVLSCMKIWREAGMSGLSGVPCQAVESMWTRMFSGRDREQSME